MRSTRCACVLDGLTHKHPERVKGAYLPYAFGLSPRGRAMTSCSIRALARPAAQLGTFALGLLLACGEQSKEEGAAGTTDAPRVEATKSALWTWGCSPSTHVEIDTCAELQAMELDLCGTYKLVADVDCSSFDAGDGGGFRPIGTQVPWDPFMGQLDGDGHVVTGLTINRPNDVFVGLFSSLTDADVRNIGFEASSINAHSIVGVVGAVALLSDFNEVYATGEVTAVAGLTAGSSASWLRTTRSPTVTPS
jgi:hypothetical protein